MAAPPVCPASCGLRLGAAVPFRPRSDALPPPPAGPRPPVRPSPAGSSPAVSACRQSSPAARRHACPCRSDLLEIEALPHQFNDKPRHMAFRHEVLHIRRQKQRLIDIPGAKILALSLTLNQTRPELNSDYSDRLLGVTYA